MQSTSTTELEIPDEAPNTILDENNLPRLDDISDSEDGDDNEEEVDKVSMWDELTDDEQANLLQSMATIRTILSHVR